MLEAHFLNCEAGNDQAALEWHTTEASGCNVLWKLGGIFLGILGIIIPVCSSVVSGLLMSDSRRLFYLKTFAFSYTPCLRVSWNTFLGGNTHHLISIYANEQVKNAQRNSHKQSATVICL